MILGKILWFQIDDIFLKRYSLGMNIYVCVLRNVHCKSRVLFPLSMKAVFKAGTLTRSAFSTCEFGKLTELIC